MVTNKTAASRDSFPVKDGESDGVKYMSCDHKREVEIRYMAFAGRQVWRLCMPCAKQHWEKISPALKDTYCIRGLHESEQIRPRKGKAKKVGIT